MSWLFKVEDPRLPADGLWEVGFYEPDGDFMQVYQCTGKGDAAALVHYLNGGSLPQYDSYLHTSHDTKGKQHDNV
jgi:hypothetical protein